MSVQLPLHNITKHNIYLLVNLCLCATKAERKNTTYYILIQNILGF